MKAGRPVRRLSQPSVDLKHIDCQLFLQQKQIYSGSGENCNSGCATIAGHMQVPAKQRKENSFIEGKGKLGGLS